MVTTIFLIFEAALTLIFILSFARELRDIYRQKFGKTKSASGVGLTAKITITRGEKSMKWIYWVFGGTIALSTIIVDKSNQEFFPDLYVSLYNYAIIIYLFFYSSLFRSIILREHQRIKEN